MPFCKFRKADGIYVSGERHKAPTHDSATELVLALPDYPDRRSERWDGGTGVRLATRAEIDVYEDKEAEAIARLEDGKTLKSLIIWLAGKHNLTPAQARGELVTIYKSL